LARIDDTPYKVRVDRAKAQLERAKASLRLLEIRAQQAERDWARAQKLGRAITPEETDAARGRLEAARAELEVGKAQVQVELANLKEAEVQLGYCTVKAPVKGIVIDRRVTLGQTVAAALNAPSLFLLATDLKRMRVWAAVNEADVGQVRVGQPVT